MKILFIVVSGLLGVVLLLGSFGCAQPAPTPITTPGSASKPASVPVKPLELKFSNWTGGATWFTQNCVVPFLKELEERSNGRIKVTLFNDESILSRKDSYDGIVSGIAHMGRTSPTTMAGRFPMSVVTELPFAYPTCVVGAKAIWDLLDSYLAKEYADAKVVVHYPAGVDVLFSTKPVTKLEDLKGVKLRFASETQKRVIELLGGVPVFVASTELYTSLERKLVEGLFYSFIAAEAWKVQEACQYATLVPVGGSVWSVYTMNLETYNKLPKDLQQVVDEVGRKWSLKIAEMYDSQDTEFSNLWQKQYGMKVYTPPASEIQRWNNAIVPIYDDFIAGLEKKGLPGKKLVEEMGKLSAKYSAK